MKFRMEIRLPLTIWELEEFIEGVRSEPWPIQEHVEIIFDVEDHFLVATIEPSNQQATKETNSE